MNPGRFTISALPLVFLALALSTQQAQAGCRYRMNALGGTSYNCDSGASGTLRQNAFGGISDTGTAIQYRKDRMGNIRSSEGRTYRQDAFGQAHVKEVESRRPLTRNLGRRAGSGRAPVCRMTAFGELRCR